MTPALILFLAAVIIPMFFGKLRSAPLWLAAQAGALAWTALAQPGADAAHAAVAAAEVAVVRGLLAPVLLRRAIRARAEPNRDLMPSNLFAWAIAMALVVLAFEFGAPTLSDRHALTLGAVGATVTVALLLLSTNDSPPAQLVAVMFMENALALFESLLPEPWPLPVHAALTGIYLLTAGVGAWLIGAPEGPSAASAGAAVEEGP